jgi:hypothetical protein
MSITQENKSQNIDKYIPGDQSKYDILDSSQTISPFSPFSLTTNNSLTHINIPNVPKNSTHIYDKNMGPTILKRTKKFIPTNFSRLDDIHFHRHPKKTPKTDFQLERHLRLNSNSQILHDISIKKKNINLKISEYI